MARGTVVLVTLVAYYALLLAIGVLAERRTKSESDFLLGGRQLGPLVAAISASASSSSVWTLLGVSGYAYTIGLRALWLFPACVGGFALNWFLVAPRLRRLAANRGSLTLTEFLAGKDRGPEFAKARVAASLIILLSLAAYVSYQFQGAGKTFAASFGTSPEQSILCGSAIVVIYTILGGFWAVSLTDTLQGMMMALTAILLPVAALWAVGGPLELWRGLHDPRGLPDGYTSLGGNGDGLDAVLPVLVLLAIGLGYPGQPHVVNRFMALRGDGDREVVLARRYSMLWAVVVYSGMILLGLCGRLLAGDRVHDDEQVFFALTDQLFPPIIAGVVVASVLSAIMSTADSQLLVAAGSVSHDLRRGASTGATATGGTSTERRTLSISRLVVLAVSAAAVLLALFAPEKIFDGVLDTWTAIGAAFGPLLLVTLWRGPVGARRSLGAMLAGFLIAVVANNLDLTRSGVVERIVPYFAAFAIALCPARRRAGPGITSA